MGRILPLKYFIFIWIFCSGYIICYGASAQEKSVQIKLGVVNLNQITRNSLMSKDIARQIDAKRKAFRNEIKKEEEKLRASNAELKKQRVILAPEPFQEKLREFQQLSAALQQKVQQRNQEFIRIRAFATREFEKERAKTLMDVAEKGRFTLVLRQREVLIRADFLDITKLVIEALNKRKTNFRIPDILPELGK